MDFTLTLRCFGPSNVNPIGQFTHTRSSDGSPERDGTLQEVTRTKIIHFVRLLFLHTHREASALVNKLPEESGQFRFLHSV